MADSISSILSLPQTKTCSDLFSDSECLKSSLKVAGRDQNAHNDVLLRSILIRIHVSQSLQKMLNMKEI